MRCRSQNTINPLQIQKDTKKSTKVVQIQIGKIPTQKKRLLQYNSKGGHQKHSNTCERNLQITAGEVKICPYRQPDQFKEVNFSKSLLQREFRCM